MLMLNVLRCTGQPPLQRNIRPQMPVVTRVRNPALIHTSFTWWFHLLHEQSCEIVSTVLCVFQMRKARLREYRSLGQSHIACKCQSLNPGLLIYQNPDVFFSVLTTAHFLNSAAKEEACWTVGFFFCSTGSRLEEAGKKVVFYTQLWIGSSFPILKVLQQGAHRHYHHLGIGLPLQI